MTPRSAAALAFLALVLSPAARAGEVVDAAGYTNPQACTACHTNAVFTKDTKSHAGNKVCAPPARWVSNNGGYCCGGYTGSHCPQQPQRYAISTITGKPDYRFPIRDNGDQNPFAAGSNGGFGQNLSQTERDALVKYIQGLDGGQNQPASAEISMGRASRWRSVTFDSVEFKTSGRQTSAHCYCATLATNQDPLDGHVKAGCAAKCYVFTGNGERGTVTDADKTGYRLSSQDVGSQYESKTAVSIGTLAGGNPTLTLNLKGKVVNVKSFAAPTLSLSIVRLSVTGSDEPKAPPSPPRREEPANTASQDVAATANAYAGWKDAATPLEKWRVVVTPPIVLAPLVLHCYHPKLAAGKTLLETLRANRADGKSAPCVAWNPVPPDNTAEAGGKKYRIREYDKDLSTTVGVKDGKLVLGKPFELEPTEGDLDKTAFGDATHVMAKEKAAEAEAPPVILLSEQTRELVWLSKDEAREYAAEEGQAKAKPSRQQNAALKPVVDKYRAKVEANLRPEAVSEYRRAWGVLKTADAIAGALDTAKVKMWGTVGDKAPELPVGDHGTNAELQLTEAQYKDLLAKKPDELADLYSDKRRGVNGVPPERFDPIVLHRTLVDIKKAGGIADAPTPGPGDPGTDPAKPPVSTENLSEDEQKLLTPRELANYRQVSNDAKNDPKDPKLAALNGFLRGRLIEEKRAEANYDHAALRDKITTVEDFEKLPAWQQRKFCYTPETVAATVAGTRREGELDNQANANTGLHNTAAGTHGPAGTQAQPQAQAKPLSPELKAKCAILEGTAEVVGPSGDSTGPGTGPGEKPIDTPLGADIEQKEKEKSEWLKPVHLFNGAKGAILGMIIGTFFGPLGMLAGAAIGAAVFYGLSKAAG